MSSDEKKDFPLGFMIKTLLKERAMSMRTLSTLTGIDTSTISRIANGKQNAKREHLLQMAEHLGVPGDTLLRAAGFDIVRREDPLHADIHASVHTIQEVLTSSKLFDEKYTVERVQQELTKYEQYALTEEGQQLIHKDFHAKVEQVSGAGPFIDQLRHMFEVFCRCDISTEERAVLGSGLLYFILSTDTIPDYVFPIGYLDDAIAVQIVFDRLSDMKNAANTD